MRSSEWPRRTRKCARIRFADGQGRDRALDLGICFVAGQPRRIQGIFSADPVQDLRVGEIGIEKGAQSAEPGRAQDVEDAVAHAEIRADRPLHRAVLGREDIGRGATHVDGQDAPAGSFRGELEGLAECGRGR